MASSFSAEALAPFWHSLRTRKRPLPLELEILSEEAKFDDWSAPIASQTEFDRRLTQVLDGASRLPAAGRREYLAAACGADHDLLRRAEQTLALEQSSRRSGGLLEELIDRDLLGTTVGSIRLVDEIGIGGMGKVYLGRDRRLGRKVAVKCIRPEQALSEEVKARFLKEAQILSRLQHPNICQIYEYIEGDETDFLVLELIEGQSLKEALRHPEELDAAAKMRIAIETTEALAAAHAAGVVHRDLKPANIMVTTAGQPKILDFGIARSLVDDAPTRTLEAVRTSSRPAARVQGSGGDGSSASAMATETGSLIGTPHYMSPEQALGERVSPASDMYSLGLLLQELFTGKSAYARKANPARLLFDVAEGKTRPIEGLDRQLTELIERLESAAPGARPSAVDTAERLRYIRDAPSRRRLARLKLVAVAVLAVLAVVMTLQAFRIRQEAERANREAALARQEADTSEEVLRVLLSLFEVSDPGTARGSEITARELLDRGAESIPERLRDQPRVRARLLDSMGVIYRKLGLLAPAATLLSDAVEARREAFGEHAPEVAESLEQLAIVAIEENRLEEADRLSQEALELRQQAYGSEHPAVGRSLDQRAQIAAKQARPQAAVDLFERSLALRQDQPDEDPEELAHTLTNLAYVYDELGELDRAEVTHRRALEIREGFGQDHPDLALSLRGLAIVRLRKGEPEEARLLLERALPIAEHALGQDSYQVGKILMNLATAETELGASAVAEEKYLRVLRIFEDRLGAGHPRLAGALGNLANLQIKQGSYAASEVSFRRAEKIFAAALGSEHPAVAACLGGLGVSLLKRRLYVQAEAQLEHGREILEAIHGPDHFALARILSQQALVYAATSRLDLAREVAAHAVRIAESSEGSRIDLASYLVVLAEVDYQAGELSTAEQGLLRARDLFAEALEPGDPRIGSALRRLANIYRDLGEHARAELLYERCAELYRQAHGAEHPVFVELFEDHAQLLDALGREQAARDLRQRARALARAAGIANRP